MDVTQERRTSVRIKEPDGTIPVQTIEYEWLPRYCAKYHMLGHDCSTKEVPPGRANSLNKTKRIW